MNAKREAALRVLADSVTLYEAVTITNFVIGDICTQIPPAKREHLIRSVTRALTELGERDDQVTTTH